jgi:hypothetical protein
VQIALPEQNLHKASMVEQQKPGSVLKTGIDNGKRPYSDR